MSFFVYAFPVTAAKSGAARTSALRRHVTKAAVRDKPSPAARIAALLEFKMAPMLKCEETRLAINSL